jgi:hypothetical protein
MKVYELIEKLMRMPVGAEVKVQGYMTVPELKSGTQVDIMDDQEIIYSVDGICEGIDLDRVKNIIYLCF